MTDKLEEWIRQTKENLERIKKLKSKDRLGTLANIQLCNEAIYASVVGWNTFLERPKVMNQFTDLELKKVFSTFQEISLKFLETDIEAVKKVKKKAPKRKKKVKRHSYIG